MVSEYAKGLKTVTILICLISFVSWLTEGASPYILILIPASIVAYYFLRGTLERAEPEPLESE